MIYDKRFFFIFFIFYIFLYGESALLK